VKAKVGTGNTAHATLAKESNMNEQKAETMRIVIAADRAELVEERTYGKRDGKYINALDKSKVQDTRKGAEFTTREIGRFWYKGVAADLLFKRSMAYANFVGEAAPEARAAALITAHNVMDDYAAAKLANAGIEFKPLAEVKPEKKVSGLNIPKIA